MCARNGDYFGPSFGMQSVDHGREGAGHQSALNQRGNASLEEQCSLRPLKKNGNGLIT